jgi:hypothetical protein
MNSEVLVQRQFRSGDEVAHGPTGEKWVLAFGDLEDGTGKVSPAGWPACLAQATDCTLLRAATDDEHITMLNSVSKIRGDHGSDFRAVRAKAYLEALEQANEQ